MEAVVVYGIDKEFLVSTNRCVIQTRVEDVKQGIEVLKKILGGCRIILMVPKGLGLQAERTGAEVRAVSPAYPDLLPKVAISVPTPPIRLMMPFACERSGLGVRSGISAMTGVRNPAIASKKTPMATINNASGVPSRST